MMTPLNSHMNESIKIYQEYSSIHANEIKTQVEKID